MNAATITLGSDKAMADELDAICASGAFRHSPQQQRLLRHLVARLGAGDIGSLREIPLAIEVFRRPAAQFDPRKDPIVRVEAGRLRERLARYYALEGEHAVIEIVVPIGSYVPLVRQRPPVDPIAAPPPSKATALVQRAAYVMRFRTIEGYRKALELYTRALNEYPECAEAFLGVAWTRICIAGFDAVPPEAGEQRAPMREAIDRARMHSASNSRSKEQSAVIATVRAAARWTPRCPGPSDGCTR